MSWRDQLPAPYEKLLELMTPEEIEDAWNRRPTVRACTQAEQPGAYFDVDAAARAIRAIESFRHTKGRWGGTPLKLQSWQTVWVVAPIFGWLYHDEEIGRPLRVVRNAWVEVPRKAGKSTLSSGIALTLLLADREYGPEVYAAAGSLEQARRVFDDGKRMAMTSKAVRDRVEPRGAFIRVPRTGGVFRALSKVAETAHGLNVSGAVIDEIHVHKRRDLIDAITTGVGARDQPLIVYITTADEGTDGTIYAELHGYTRAIADGTATDPAHYGVVWCAEEGDDPFAEETWYKANPGLGVSPSLAYLRREAEKAKATPSYMPTFQRLSLNLRVRSSARWLDMQTWDQNAGAVDTKRLSGRRAWGGLDLSAVSDFSAWAIVVESRKPGVELEVIPRFWLPEDRADQIERQTKMPISQWVSDGLITLTEGDAVDYSVIEDQIVEDCTRMDIQRVSFDRMFAGQLVQNLDFRTRGVDVVPVAQTYMGMSPGAKEFERLLREHRVAHGGNPVLRWHASVTEVYTDGQDNIRPAKPDRYTSTHRIDGIHAAVMAMDGYVRRPKRKPRAMAT